MEQLYSPRAASNLIQDVLLPGDLPIGVLQDRWRTNQPKLERQKDNSFVLKPHSYTLVQPLRARQKRFNLISRLRKFNIYAAFAAFRLRQNVKQSPKIKLERNFIKTFAIPAFATLLFIFAISHALLNVQSGNVHGGSGGGKTAVSRNGGSGQSSKSLDNTALVSHAISAKPATQTTGSTWKCSCGATSSSASAPAGSGTATSPVSASTPVVSQVTGGSGGGTSGGGSGVSGSGGVVQSTLNTAGQTAQSVVGQTSSLPSI